MDNPKKFYTKWKQKQSRKVKLLKSDETVYLKLINDKVIFLLFC